MNSRIRTLRKALSLNQKEFAAKIGLKQSAVSYMEKNGSTITEQNIKVICSQFCVNEVWLRTGEGEMFLEVERTQKEFFDIFDSLSPALQNHLLRIAHDLVDLQSELHLK